ncbi:MAG TPA: trypsin-like peptidase domain-containing protein [Acidobacteriaceae bacterium]
MKIDKSSLFQWVRNRRLSTVFGVLATLTVGILIGSVLSGRVHGKETGVDSSDAAPLHIPDPTHLGNGFAAIAKQVGPAVVNINTESTPHQEKTARNRRGFQAQPQPQDPNGDDADNDQQNGMQDFFNRFFGGQNPFGGGDGGEGAGTRRALGSGFIVDPRGYIITNNHVVEKADKIYVKLSTDPDGGPGDNGRPATVIGVDKDTDIAVIKINTKEPLPTIKLGNSDGADVGDWVLAIGSPFGLSQTVSAGIVSAKNRSLNEGGRPSQFQRFIQTDAAINPGNSGGPLVNMAGEVIGMNTAIYTQSSGYEGVGFAMPSNTIVNVYNMLISPEHKVVRGSIGITFQAALPAAVGRVYGFNSGILVNTVEPKGPAAAAGIQPGDIITTVDGKPVKTGDDLVADISVRRPGTTAKIGYMRDGKQSTATVAIADRAKLFAGLLGGAQEEATPDQSNSSESKLGITAGAVPMDMASKLGIPGGVIVKAVRPGTFADDIALPVGVVITSINRKPVTDLNSFNAAVNSLKSGSDVVFIVRDPRNKAAGNTYVGGTLP